MAWQATIGDVEKESLFATFPSLASRRKLLSILATVLLVVGNVTVVSAACCSKIDGSISNVPRSGRMPIKSGRVPIYKAARVCSAPTHGRLLC